MDKNILRSIIVLVAGFLLIAATKQQPSLFVATDPDNTLILMYHYIRDVDPDEDELGYNLSISPELFEEHLIWLQENQYTPVRMDTLAACLRGEEACPERAVALTFDDGYEDAATIAFPILQRYDFPATFYIISGRVGQEGYMSWEQIRMLHEHGMEIGSHTISHPDLTLTDQDVLEKQLVQSRATLEKHINVPVQSFCYPFGFYDDATVEAVRNAGYTNAVTTYASRTFERMYELPRYRLIGGDNSETLAIYAPPYTYEPDEEQINQVALFLRFSQLPWVQAFAPGMPTSLPGFITEDYVNLREGPGTDYPMPDEATFFKRDNVTIHSASSGEGCSIWFEVEGEHGEQGWVCSLFVQVSDKTSSQQSAATIKPRTLNEDEVLFAVIGDFGLEGPMEAEVAELVTSWSPDFIVTTGDNNYPHGEAETIDANIGQYYHEYIYPYKGTYGEGATTNRFFPSLGNHDLVTDNGQPYYDYFELPGNERYYDVTEGPVAIFILNSMPGDPDGTDAESDQAAWLKEKLADSTACWNIVVFHHPPYTSDPRGAYDWMRWPFEEWGADTVFCGHHHTYERLIVDGFPYFVNGLGGGARYTFDGAVEGSKIQYNEDHGAMRVIASPNEMTIEFITRTDEVIETYTLEKTCK